MKKMMLTCGLVAMLALTGLGCSTTAKSAPSATAPELDLADLARDEFVVMDTIEGSGKVTQVLMFTFPMKMKRGSLGGNVTATSNPLAALLGFQSITDKALGMAQYEVLAQGANADSVVPFSTTVETSGIPFLFRRAVATAKAKAIRVKADE